MDQLSKEEVVIEKPKLKRFQNKFKSFLNKEQETI